MSGRLRKSERKAHSIEELAIQHLTARYRQNRKHIRARMAKTFGRKATEQVIESTAAALEMCDPNFKRHSR